MGAGVGVGSGVGTGFGVARVFGIALGGILAGSIGEQKGFWVSAAISLLALILFAPGYLREKNAPEEA